MRLDCAGINVSRYDRWCYEHHDFCTGPALDVGVTLRDIYDLIPTSPCAGKCEDSCGPIEMSPAERGRIRQVYGLDIPVHQIQLQSMLTSVSPKDWRCPALKNGKCSVYELRPIICRIWGQTELLPCPYGCVPSEMMSYDDSLVLMAAAMYHGGSLDAIKPSDLRRTLDANPAAREASMQYMAPFMEKAP